ncbi:HD domain-containing phosphohydrolase [Paenibacillus qinlingensis]|uniref:HD-GYP domain-containing protein n=1 Tax=Paenibacillus qinlingensis TaxID=1837343 RepID=A0ABU1P399_9BACL|nr:HD domain-containing phosphohydrolase [Paenibacillus qinlingensis]MDR6554229.1 hypothetical protein [Paenibacillus qinlingensis]
MNIVLRFSRQPIHQLCMFIIGSMAGLCTLSGLCYWLISRNSESYVYTMTSATVTLFGWAMYGLQHMMPAHSRYSKVVAPALIFLVIVVVTLYNPLTLQQMWVALIFFPVMLSLLVEYRIYLYGAVLFLLYFVCFQMLGPNFTPYGETSSIIMATTKGVYALGAIILGGIVQAAMYQYKANADAASFQKQKQQVINILESFISVGERKTQTSRKEIGEMSALLKALVHAYGGLKVQEWEIDLLSLMHFVSRVKLPDYMFEKEGKLSEFEYEVVQEHCYMARELCEGIPEFQEVEKAFLYHHEKIDGTGYPFRLEGAQIPILSQMLGIVEVYLALTTPRSYRQETTSKESLAEIKKLTHVSFRADVVEAFGKVID